LIALIVVVCLGAALGGAIITDFVEWPDSLFLEGLLDLSVGLFQIAVVCYCLGLMVARNAETIGSGLRAWPLVLIPVSLVVIKGLGRPFGVVLVPFIVVLVLHLLLVARNRRVAVVTRGLVVFILAMVPLYWVRHSSDVMAALAILGSSEEPTIRCYREFPSNYSYDSKVGPFTISGDIDSCRFPVSYGQVHFLLEPLGILSYLREKEPARARIYLRSFGQSYGLYFDDERGLLVRRNSWGTFYAGPHAVGDMPAAGLGRFESPVVCPCDRGPTIVFDHKTGCFYEISFNEKEVHQGPPILDPAFEPCAWKLFGGACSVRCNYPSLSRAKAPYASDQGRRYVPIVNESGSVAVLDRRTWELRVDAGHLPRSYRFSRDQSCRPRDCFDYDVGVIIKQPDGEYAGLMAICLARRGVPATVAVFDKNGRILQRDSQRGSLAFLLPPIAVKYLAESLHPPVLALASFFTAYSFEAGATHRAIFLMPNSFVALERDRQTNLFFQLLWALLSMVPGLLFAGFLGWRIVKDARRIGLSRRSRRLWFLGTLAFGLPAYITYRQTRPRVALIRCRNCGNLRRADMELCHHCRSEWDIPALNAPAWRVTDGLH